MGLLYNTELALFQEMDRFKKAFDDPEFCKLMSDYVEDLQNPEYRAVSEACHGMPSLIDSYLFVMHIYNRKQRPIYLNWRVTTKCQPERSLSARILAL